MFLHMTGVTMSSFLEYGCLSSKSSLGGSVARASAAHVSMIRLTQSIWTEVRGGSSLATPPKNTMNMATTLTVSWN
jgi:hypothetical protein